MMITFALNSLRVKSKLLCSQDASVNELVILIDGYDIHCSVCGSFSTTEDGCDALCTINSQDKVKLSSYTRSRHILGRPATFSEGHVQGAITIREAIMLFPRSIFERADRALLNLVAMMQFAGDSVNLTPDDYPVLFCDDGRSLFYMKRMLVDLNYVETGNGVHFLEIGVTPQGLEIDCGKALNIRSSLKKLEAKKRRNNLMSERFPDVDWYCDRCRAYLNGQLGFDDHKYIWRCKECGYKNSISAANIFEVQ